MFGSSRYLNTSSSRIHKQRVKYNSIRCLVWFSHIWKLESIDWRRLLPDLVSWGNVLARPFPVAAIKKKNKRKSPLKSFCWVPRLMGRHTDPQLGETPLTRLRDVSELCLVWQVSIIFSEPSVKNNHRWVCLHRKLGTVIFRQDQPRRRQEGRASMDPSQQHSVKFHYITNHINAASSLLHSRLLS